MSPNALAFAKSEFGIELSESLTPADVTCICSYFRELLQNHSRYDTFIAVCKAWRSYEGYFLNENKSRIEHFKQALRLFSEATTNEGRCEWLAVTFVYALCHAGYKIKYESGKRHTWDI